MPWRAIKRKRPCRRFTTVAVIDFAPTLIRDAMLNSRWLIVGPPGNDTIGGIRFSIAFCYRWRKEKAEEAPSPAIVLNRAMERSRLPPCNRPSGPRTERPTIGV